MAILIVRSPALPEQANQSVYFPSGQVSPDSGIFVPLAGNPVNVGAGDFWFRCWIRPDSTGNTASGGAPAGANLFMDRDRLSPTLGGWGLGLDAGTISLWIDADVGGSQSFTGSGSTDLRDEQWHVIDLARDQSTGDIRVWVDGTREINGTVPVGGDVSYSFVEGEGEYDSDLTYGVEKAGFEDVSYAGYMTECQWYDALPSFFGQTSYTPPTSRVADDATNLVTVHHMDGTGTSITDSVAGNQSPGTLVTTQGAARSTLSPFA